jgi:2-methylisocitrate lyase-like PEP mutase family enzyme
MDSSQKVKAEYFKKLHHGSDILVLPNIWDPLGAALLESLGYPAVATASASVALTSGFEDGERVPFGDVLIRLKAIAGSVNLPVTADIESGYAASNEELEKNIEQVINTGIVGINLEDHDKQSDALFSLEAQSKRIRMVRKVAETMNVPLFINARTDVYLRGRGFVTAEEKLNETIRRGKAYLDAGADGLFPPAMKDKEQLAKLIASLRCPVNVIAFPGIPDFKILKEIGVARLSLGPGFLKIAIKAMKQLALKLKNYEGLDEVIGNELSSEELKKLVTKLPKPSKPG